MMKLNRNPEIRKESLCYLLVTVVLMMIAGAVSEDRSARLLLLLLCLCLLGVHYVFALRRYRKIERLSSAIDRILHGTEQVLITESREGELAILSSEIHKMTIRLREQTELLEADKVKLTHAIEDIFHQMRTPLTSMNLVVTLLSRDELEDRERIRLVRDLKRQLERIRWLVESLLKMSKIDAHTALFLPCEISVRDLIQKSADPFLILMDVKNIELRLKLEDVKLEADEGWTIEALGNLIKNCVEHTPEGGWIEVAASENLLFTEITITDSGEGFRSEDLPYLFERFYKGKNATAESIGIGLALSRMILTSENGTIKTENAPDGGARFVVRFYKSTV